MNPPKEFDVSIYFLASEVPKDFWSLLEQRDGAPKLIARLKEAYPLQRVAKPGAEQRASECTALFHRDTNRLHQAIQIMAALYEQLLAYQIEADERIHKGMPLVWLRDFRRQLGHLVTAKRYAMLTLCEDAIREKGAIDALNGHFKTAR